MSGQFDAVLAEYRDRMKEEEGIVAAKGMQHFFSRVDDFMLPVGEAPAEVLRALIIAHGSRTIVELGTSYGFSTLFLADAARQTGGRLITFELSEKKQAYARERIVRAGLADHVEWRLGNAVDLLGELEGPVDFAFIDLWKDLYVPCFHALEPKLAANAIIAADNMLQPVAARENAERYRAAVRANPAFTSTLMPIGHGIELSCRVPG